jgi:hypothetical protein
MFPSPRGEMVMKRKKMVTLIFCEGGFRPLAGKW